MAYHFFMEEAIYAKEDFTEEDGNKASELEAEFADRHIEKEAIQENADTK